MNSEKEQELQEIIKRMKEKISNLEDILNKKYNPFEIEEGDTVYYYGDYWDIYENDENYDYDIERKLACKDKKIIKARQQREYLNALLEKFAYKNNAVVTEGMWKDDYIYKYYFCYDFDSQMYTTTYTLFSKSLSEIYFTSEKVCQRAIDEIVIPFMEESND